MIEGAEQNMATRAVKTATKRKPAAKRDGRHRMRSDSRTLDLLESMILAESFGYSLILNGEGERSPLQHIRRLP
jgi:hypothetical protein